jgi:Zn finger protein HypA/HybF involved in hydrogenase expression
MTSKQLLLETEAYSRCRKCGRQLITTHEVTGCTHCGAVDIKDGNLERIKSALNLITEILIEGLD